LHAKIKELETRKVDPKYPYIDNSGYYWIIATIAEFEAGDFETARKYYRQLLKEYPVDFRKYSVRKSLKRMDAVETKMRREISQGGDS
jgi:hypothetical protein